MIRTRCLALALLWAGATLGAASTSTGGDELDYRLPRRWSVARSEAGVLQLSHTDEDDRRSGIAVTAGLPMPSTLRRALKETLSKSLSGYDLDYGDASRRETASGRDALVLEQDIEHDDRDDLYIAAVAIEGDDDTYDLALLITPDRASKYDRQEDFEAFVASLRVPGRPKEPDWDDGIGKSHGGLDAFYWSQQLVNRINAFGGMDMALDIDYLRFLPGGHVYRDLPEDGTIDDLDLRREQRENPTRCGIYRMSKRSMSIEWLDRYGLLETERLPYEFDDDGDLELDGERFWRLRPQSDLKLDGRFGSLSHSSGSIGDDSTSVTSTRSLTFRSDGTFELTGFSSFSFSHGKSGGQVSGTGRKQRDVATGRYTIEGHTLQLEFSDGTTTRRTFHWLEPDADSDGVVYIDGRNYNG